MPIGLKVQSLVLLPFLSLHLRAQGLEFKKLDDAHACFALRQKTDASVAPPLYRAISSCNFREQSCHERLVALQQGAAKDDALVATEWLAQDALADGRYSEALEQSKILVKGQPDDKGAANAQALFAALASLGDQKLISRSEKRIPSVSFDGNVGSRVEINGKDAEFLFDTGANVSMMSEGQAGALGLEVHEMKATIGVATGDQVNFRGAGAAHLRLGGVELENVAFLIAPDDAEPFVEFPKGRRGILGLPVLLAAGTLRSDGNTFDIGYESKAYRRATANICAYGPTFNVELSYDGKPLVFALDRGTTDLYATFAKAFPKIATEARRQTFNQRGIRASRDNDVLVAPSIDFVLAGARVTLTPARIFVKATVAVNSQVLGGNLGMDLLNQTGGWAIDFRVISPEAIANSECLILPFPVAWPSTFTL